MEVKKVIEMPGLEDKAEGFEVWVTFQEDAEVLVRHLGPEALREIRQRAITWRWTRKQEDSKVPVEPEETVDYAQCDRLLGREAVRGWRGFTHAGEEFPWTPENCDLLMARWDEFARFVARVSLELEGFWQQRLGLAHKRMIEHIRSRVDFPGVSCKSCREMFLRDGAVLRCETKEGCLIPPVGARQQRVLGMRELAARLSRVIPPEAVFRICGATREDLELMASAQDALEEVFSG